VRNRTIVPAVLEGNRLDGTVVPLLGPGTVDPGGAPSAGGVAPDRSGNAPRPGAGPAAAAGPVAEQEIEAKLRLLKRLFEQALITEEEYSAKKADLLDRL
jgi:hypothetical protein